MKIYVASAYVNRLEAKTIMVALRKLGHEITHDWTIDSVDPTQTPEQQEAFLQECGARDWTGLLNAEALVFVNHGECRDAMTELGIALADDITTFVLFPKRRTSVFFHRADYRLGTFEELIRAIREEEG